jgi:hypothetical protein
LDTVGGKEGFLKIFGDGYIRFLADPVLKELFDASHADTRGAQRSTEGDLVCFTC